MTSSPTGVSWSLAGCVGSTAGATLDLAEPRAGLRPTGSAPELGLLGVDLRTPCRPVDQWLRGTDLIAVYEPADPRRLRATAVWRGWPAAPGITAWELVLSAQTALVNSDSALAVVSEAAATAAVWGGPAGSGWRWTAAQAGRPRPEDASCVLVRGLAGPQTRTSLLVAVHPDDVRQIDVEHPSGLCRVRCWLFSTAIEKGQLFRSRVLAALGPAQDDEAWAGRLAAAFAASPAPLTS